jgi:hypothetical protein
MLLTKDLRFAGPRSKLSPLYTGPLRVKRVINANAYEVELPPQLRIHPVINISRLKRYHDGAADFPDRPPPHARPPPDAIDSNGMEQYEVERILSQRGHSYLVLWKGYSEDDASWVKLADLAGAPLKLKEFRERQAQQLAPLQLSVLSLNAGSRRCSGPAGGAGASAAAVQPPNRAIGDFAQAQRAERTRGERWADMGRVVPQRRGRRRELVSMHDIPVCESDPCGYSEWAEQHSVAELARVHFCSSDGDDTPEEDIERRERMGLSVVELKQQEQERGPEEGLSGSPSRCRQPAVYHAHSEVGQRCEDCGDLELYLRGGMRAYLARDHGTASIADIYTRRLAEHPHPWRAQPQ